MTGEEVREVFETILPQQALKRLGVPCGVSERQRQLSLGMWVRARGMAAGPPGGAYQADMLRLSLEWAVPRVPRSACYGWFDAPLEPCLAALARLHARAQQVDLSGLLGEVKAWYIIDSTAVHVRARPACGGSRDRGARSSQGASSPVWRLRGPGALPLQPGAGA